MPERFLGCRGACVDRGMPQGGVRKRSSMEPSCVAHYRCPASHSPLKLTDAVMSGPAAMAGTLESAEGLRFAIEDGTPNLIWPAELSEIEAHTKCEYDQVAEKIYDAAMDWQ